MAIELRVTSVTALVTGEPRERQVYQGQGDARRVVGRFTDADGRPLSAVSAVVVAEPLGMLGDATVLAAGHASGRSADGLGGPGRGQHNRPVGWWGLRGDPDVDHG